VTERLYLVAAQPLPGCSAIQTERRSAYAQRILPREDDRDGRFGRRSQAETPVEPPLACLDVALVRRDPCGPAVDPLDDDISTGSRVDLDFVGDCDCRRGEHDQQATDLAAKEGMHGNLRGDAMS